MATGLDANTSTRLVLLPALVRVAGRSIGPTRGGVELTFSEDYVQPEADGVNQPIVGFGYTRSKQVTATFSALEFSAENMALANDLAAGTGTAPNLTFTPIANMTMYTSSQFLASPGLQIYVPFSDTVTGFYFISMPTGRIRGTVNLSGANGEATIQYTVTSAATAASPDAVPFTWGRVASLPAETGGP